MPDGFNWDSLGKPVTEHDWDALGAVVHPEKAPVAAIGQPITNIANAAIEGAKQGWGPAQSAETIAANQKADKDLPPVVAAITKGLNWLGDNSGRPFNAAFAAAQAGVAKAGEEAGMPDLGRDAAAALGVVPLMTGGMRAGEPAAAPGGGPRPSAGGPRVEPTFRGPGGPGGPGVGATPPEPGPTPGSPGTALVPAGGGGPEPTAPPSASPGAPPLALPAPAAEPPPAAGEATPPPGASAPPAAGQPPPEPRTGPAEAPQIGTRVTFFHDERGDYASGTLMGVRKDGRLVVDMGAGPHKFVEPNQLVNSRDAPIPDRWNPPQKPSETPGPKKTDDGGTATQTKTKAKTPTAEDDESWVQHPEDVADAIAKRPLPDGWELGTHPERSGYVVYDDKDQVVGHGQTMPEALRVARTEAAKRKAAAPTAPENVPAIGETVTLRHGGTRDPEPHIITGYTEIAPGEWTFTSRGPDGAEHTDGVGVLRGDTGRDLSNAQMGPWTEAGKNEDGETIYSNPEGVHAVNEGGVPYTEPLKDGKPANAEGRPPQFVPVPPPPPGDEKKKTAAETAAADKPADITPAADKPKAAKPKAETPATTTPAADQDEKPKAESPPKAAKPEAEPATETPKPAAAADSESPTTEAEKPKVELPSEGAKTEDAPSEAASETPKTPDSELPPATAPITQNPAADSAITPTTQGEAPAAPEIVEHTTSKGKTLRGVVRPDLTRDEAKAIDPYSFKKDGGWFIREAHIGKLPPAPGAEAAPAAETPTAPKPKATTPGVLAPTGDAYFPPVRANEKLWSKSGREMSPVPNFNTDGNRASNNARSKLNEWLLNEARKEAEATGDTHLSDILRGWDHKNFSQSDRDTANDILFGGDAPKAEHRTAPKPKAEPEAEKPPATEAPKPNPMSGGSYAAVVDGVVTAKGNKADAMAALKKARAEGRDAFLGRTQKPVGAKWDEAQKPEPEDATEAPDAESKPEAEAPKDLGPHHAAGVSARKRGEPRELPSYFTDKKGKNAKDWLRGWDAAEGPKPAAKVDPARQMAEDAFRGAIKNTGAAQHDGSWRIIPVPFVADQFAVEYVPAVGAGKGQPIIHGAPGDATWSLQDAQKAAVELADKVRPFGTAPKPAPKAEAEEAAAPAPGESQATPPEAPPASSAAPDLAPDPAWAQAHADDLRGEVVFDNGEVALIRGHSILTGDPVYLAARRSSGLRTRVDVDTFDNTRALFTPEQLDTLRKEKKAAAAADVNNHARHPQGPFAGGKRIVATESIDPKLKDAAIDLSQLIGLGKTRIFLVDPRDVRGPDAAERYGLFGPYAPVQSGALSETGGSARMLPNGDFYIVVAPRSRGSAAYETMAHEIGHVLEKEVFQKATPAEQNAIRDAYTTWLKEHGVKDARPYIEALRNHTTGKLTTAPQGMNAAAMTPYWRSFGEWFADQTSRWATSEENPQAVLGKFSERIMGGYRNLIAASGGDKYRPTEAMRDWLNKQAPAAEPAAPTAAAPKAAPTATPPKATPAATQAPARVLTDDEFNELEPRDESEPMDATMVFPDGRLMAAEPMAAATFLNYGYGPEGKAKFITDTRGAEVGLALYPEDPQPGEIDVRVIAPMTDKQASIVARYVHQRSAQTGKPVGVSYMGDYFESEHGGDFRREITALDNQGALNFNGAGLQQPVTAPNVPGQESNDGRQDRPGTDGLDQPGSGGAGPQGGTAGKPTRVRTPKTVAPSPATDDAPAGGGGTGEETGPGPGSQTLSGDGNVYPGGDADTGRPGAGGEGLAADDDRGGRPKLTRPNFHIDDPERIIGGTPTIRFARNKAALEALEEIEADGREPTQAELETMASFVGWGSFGQDLFQGNFDYVPRRPGWEDQARWLRQRLGREAWESAQESIINAHYTDPPTVNAMWDMVRNMGFKGGRVLEPSMGVGNFFGLMPRDLMDASALTGIEMETSTGQMAKLLYPKANVQIKGYQDSKTPDNFYDLVIGNWPFAKQGPSDRRYNKFSPNLHNYFFLKALDQVRPGGLVVGITSAMTMDSAGTAARMEMARKGELIASYRLPSGAFEQYAGTSVVTDIIILRKRAEPIANPQNEDWVEASMMDTPAGTPVRVNKYYQDRPQNVLGQIDFGHGTTYGRAGMIVHRPDNLMLRLAALPLDVPADGYQPTIRGNEPRFLANNSGDRQGSITIGEDGKLYQVQGDQIVLLEDIHKGLTAGTPKAQKARQDQVRGLVGMRKTYGKLVDAERDGADNTEDLRKDLAKQYQDFRTAHGTIGASDGLRVMDRVADPSYPIVRALERANGDPSRILSEPTVKSKVKLDNPTITDAYIMARNEQIGFDMDRVAELTKRPVAEVEKELLDSGAVVRTPGGGFAPKDVYISGNVKVKLQQAKAAQEAGEDLQGTIDQLIAARPPDVPYYQIEPKLGATWVGDDAYRAFVGEILNLTPSQTQQVEINFVGARWRVHLPPGVMNKEEARTVWGHPRVDFDDLLKHAMGNTPAKVYDPKDRDGGPYFNEKATEEANAKISALREKFSDWAWSDPERKIAFETAYNDIMNAIAKTLYDGSFMDMSGMALRRGDDPFSLRQHQINAIWRGIIQKRGLFAHEVGTGKTYTMGGIAIEGRRYGNHRKPLIFAHNANSASVAREIGEMYPGAQVLYIPSLSPDEIKTTLYRVANEDWDVIVMPHSLIDRMALTEETLNELAAEQIAQLEAEAIAAAADHEVPFTLTPEMMDNPESMKKMRSPTAKDLVKARLAIKTNIKKQAERASKEGAVPFENLGIDAIIVDEAHEFKKPVLSTQMQMKGLNTAPSQRSIGLDFLTKYTKRQNNGSNVYLFTGTPVTNTLNEIFNQARYFMQDRMDDAGVADWDTWFATFADAESAPELAVTGDFEPVTRLSAFQNIDELVRMMGEFTDVVQAKDMPEFKPRATPSGKTLTSPDLTDEEKDFLLNGRTANPEGRPYKKVIRDVGEMSPDQRIALNTIRERVKSFRALPGKERYELKFAKPPDRRLPIITDQDGPKASLDARLFDPDAEDHPDNKVNRVARNVLKHYQEPGAGQVIFVDTGYNPAKVSEGRENRFVLVDDIVEKLVRGGIPKKEIRVVGGGITAEKKKQIADDMNSGKLRVVIGLSSTLGVGVNMQKNLRAMHHMDAPWRPGDLEQRNGRGERQGNEWNTVLEYRYVTEGIDGRRWQVLVSKDKFIKQFIAAFNDTSGKRIGTIEGGAADISDDEDITETLSAAAGDPRLMIRAKYRNDVNRLERRERIHTGGQADAISRVRTMRQNVANYRARAAELERIRGEWDEIVDAAAAAAKAAGDDHRWYEAEVDGEKMRLGDEIQAALDAKVKAGLPKGKVTVMATINGLELVADWSNPRWEKPQYSVGTPDDQSLFDVELPTVRRLVSGIQRYTNDAAYFRHQADETENSIPALEKQAAQGFPQADKLKKLRRQYADLETDLQNNPTPPPAWFRNGAPIDDTIYVDGQPRIVRGHRMLDDYLIVTDEGEVPYMQAMDENGQPMFEQHDPPPKPQPREVPDWVQKIAKDMNGKGLDGEVIWHEDDLAVVLGDHYGDKAFRGFKKSAPVDNDRNVLGMMTPKGFTADEWERMAGVRDDWRAREANKAALEADAPDEPPAAPQPPPPVPYRSPASLAPYGSAARTDNVRPYGSTGPNKLRPYGSR